MDTSSLPSSSVRLRVISSLEGILVVVLSIMLRRHIAADQRSETCSLMVFIHVNIQ